MNRKYRETFAQVRASDRLRAEVMDMTELERRPPKRGVPRAALIAAVLALVLAGTAIAAETLEWLKVDSVDGSREDFFNEPTYHVRGGRGFVPLESLSPEIRERTAQAEASNGDKDAYTFGTWSEMEEFLGLELADNPRLEQMDQRKNKVTLTGCPSISGNCIMQIGYLASTPYDIFVLSSCKSEDGSQFDVMAVLYTEAFLADPQQDPDTLGYYIPEGDGTEVEEYLTPGGLAVTIVTDAGDSVIAAYFEKNDARFRISLTVNTDEAMALMKGVLDAYE